LSFPFLQSYSGLSNGLQTKNASGGSGWSSPTWTDNFATDNWTYVGTGWGVASGIMKATAVAQNADRRAYRALGSSLSNTLWTCDIDVKPTTMNNGDSGAHFILSSGTTSIYNGGYDSEDNLGFSFQNESPSNGLYFRGWVKDGTTPTNTTAITFTTTQYYVRIQRTTATNFRHNLFTNSGRTTHASGSPVNTTINSTIQALDNAVFNVANFPATGSATIEYDNLTISDNT